MKPKFAIQYKFLAVTTFLMVVCISSYLLIATHIFRQDKREFIFDFNRSLVTNISAEFETEFRLVSEKLELFATLSHHPAAAPTVQGLIDRQENIVFIQELKIENENSQLHFVRDEFLKTYSVPETFFTTELPLQRPIPRDEIESRGEAIWNATVEGGPPLIGYGRSVIEEGEDHIPIRRLAIIAYVQPERLYKDISRMETNDVLLLNRKGELLLSRDVKDLARRADYSTSELFLKAQDSKLKTSVLEFKGDHEPGHDFGRGSFLGAFSKSARADVLIATQISEEKAFLALQSLTHRSLLFGTIVITLSFIAAVLLSRSLTGPIETLAERMELVGQGDLETEVNVDTNDEIRLLSDTFMSMISDLKISRQKLEEANRDLEEKVQERTRQLDERNQMVKETQEALLRTTRLASVGEVAGRAAHEVLNPLTALMARLQKMQKRLKSDAERPLSLLTEILEAWKLEYSTGGFDALIKTWQARSQIHHGSTLWDEDVDNLSAVVRSTRQEFQHTISDTDFVLHESLRISKIVNQMRSLTVISADRREYTIEKIVNDSVHVMEDLFHKYGVVIEMDLGAAETIVLVDRDELMQSLTNILRNSLQALTSVAMPEFHGRVRVQGRAESETYVLDISDNGPGIVEENQAKLFESQFSTKNRDEGTGLGLSISRRFVRAYGGDLLFVSSTPLEATIFRMILPIQKKKIEEVAA